ncbi:PaaI family thioesterase [Gordonia sp. SID5947]|uniref:hotdog domain-containing protein n=1 Tax=Gordonia sp. SID5947 TaxID=2690315 RepID=UPI00136A6D23|nr:hotdog domain-containing protein [Gordonia sp. SID5947]MYR08680.1 PaaI family thioesterase [Gordonia sp. SID5947]
MTGDRAVPTRIVPRDPVTAFGIGNVAVSGPATVRAEQRVGADLVDHRGRIDLPALAVLFDHLGGLPFIASDPQRSPCVQARLAISMQGHVDVGDLVTGEAELLVRDEMFGTTRVDIVTSTGRICCSGTARNVGVGRTVSGNPGGGRGVDAPPPVGDAADQRPMPPVIEPGLDGRAIVEQIAAGTRPAGHLTELLNGRIDTVDHPLGVGVRFTVETEPWMGNLFGTMHGGVIAAVVAQGCALAGQANAAAGRDYQLADLAISFLRSPAVQGTDVVVDVTPVKVGRRIASFEATMHAHDGMLLSRGAADVHYR